MNDSILQQRQALEQLLAQAGNIGIVLGQHQNLDTVAAALSMYLMLQDSGKNSQIISLKEPIVEFSSLVGVDHIRPNFTGTTKTLTVSFPYREGEIEKVSYNIEGDRLNVNLFADGTGITFSEKDIRYIREGATPNLIVTFGVSDLSELQGFVDSAASKIINIDSNPSNSLFGDIVIVDPSFSSLSEVVAKIGEMLSLQIEFDVAQNLLDGVMSATQNFTSPKTSPVAFEMTGVLMQKGAIRRQMKESRSQDTSLQMLGGKNQVQKQISGGKHGGQKQFGGQKFQPKSQSFQNTQAPKKHFNQMQQAQPQHDTDQSFPADDFAAQQPQRNQNSTQNESSEEKLNALKAQIQSLKAQQNYPEEQNEEPQIPTEDEAPSDWFTPKVFKSNKNNN